MAEFNIKKALQAVRSRKTEEQIAEQEERNAAGRGRIDPSSPTAQIALAKQYEAEILERLRLYGPGPYDDLTVMRIHRAMDRLGELAAMQGDYKRAVELTVSPERRERYRQIVKAIKISDDKNCDCPDDRLVDRANKTEFTSPAMMTIDTILTSQGLKNVDRCRKCGHMNVR